MENSHKNLRCIHVWATQVLLSIVGNLLTKRSKRSNFQIIIFMYCEKYMYGFHIIVKLLKVGIL